MIKEAIGTAPTLDEAKSKAIAQLDAPLDADVIIEVMEQATKKTLGLFGGSLAKVRAYYETQDKQEELPKQEKTETAKQIPQESLKKEKESGQKKQTAAPPAMPEQKRSKETREETRQAGKVVSSDNAPANYLKSVLSEMGIKDVSVITRETDEEIFLEIVSDEDYGNIIGRRGETLDALQYLVRLSVSRAENEERRISLNIGDYRSKREATLKSLAGRQADRVLKYGRNAVLDPMNPYERRIIHTTVQDIDGVQSHSIGEGEGRRVVITPTGGRSFGYQDRGRSRFDGRNKSGGERDARAPYKPEPREPREPKTDIQGGFSYGKIEPKSKN